MTPSDTWQKCPVCEGSGTQVVDRYITAISIVPCPTCQGERIISRLTGKPPQK